MESMGPFSICCLMAQKREKSGSPAHSCKKIWRKNKVWNEQRDGPFKLKAHTSSRVWHKGGVPKCWSKIRRVFKTSALSFVVCLQDAPTLCAVYTLLARKILLPCPVLKRNGGYIKSRAGIFSMSQCVVTHRAMQSSKDRRNDHHKITQFRKFTHK